MDEEAVCVTSTLASIPTYIRVFFPDDENFFGDQVILVCNTQRRKSASSEGDATKIMTNANELSVLEYTGSPLIVDLDETNCQLPMDDLLYSRGTHWTPFEAKFHRPLPKDAAQLWIQQHLDGTEPSKCIFGICDMKDATKTLAVGSFIDSKHFWHQIIIEKVNIDPDHFTSANWFLEQQSGPYGGDCSRSVREHRTYYLSGSDYRMATNLTLLPKNSSITVLKTNDEMKMNIQVIVSHKSSPLHKLWRRLLALELLLNLLKQCSTNQSYDKNTEVNITDGTAMPQLQRLMSDMVSSAVVFSNTTITQLFDLFCMCKTLGDIQFLLGALFVRVSLISFHVKLSPDSTVLDDETLLNRRLKGILCGKMTVPSFGLRQSTEIVLELGMYVLKAEHLSLVKSNSIHNVPLISAFTSKWKKITDSYISAAMNQYALGYFSEDQRLIPQQCLKEKLDILYLAHIMAEFVQPFSRYESILSSEGVQGFHEELFNKFLLNTTQNPCFANDMKLYDVCFPLSLKDAHLVDGEVAQKVVVTVMREERNLASEHTIWLQAHFPVVPFDVQLPNISDVTLKEAIPIEYFTYKCTKFSAPLLQI